MAGITVSRRSLLVVFCVGVPIGCGTFIGCGKGSATSDVEGAPSVRVVYQGQPLGNVQVRLHESRGGPVLAQSISQQNGIASFTQLPAPEPSNYFVTVESLGDGDWMLDPKACRELSDNLSLKNLESSRQQLIEIPDGAVQTLTLSQRR